MELALDTDGASGLSGDATHQSQTSLRYRGGGSIDANRVPFFVLPLPTTWPDQFDIRLGDFAAVVFAGRVAFAAFADFGPKDNLGEGSLELFRQLGQERVRPNGSVRDVGMGPGIITIVFPKSRLAADLANQDALIGSAARGLPFPGARRRAADGLTRGDGARSATPQGRPNKVRWRGGSL